MATDYIILDSPATSAPVANNKLVLFGVSRDSFIDYFPHETITEVKVTMSNQTGHKVDANWLDAPYSLHEVRIEACGNNLTAQREGTVTVTTFISSDPQETPRTHTYKVIQAGGTDIVPPFPRVEFSLFRPYGDPGSTLKGEITTNLPYYKKKSLELNRNTYISGKISVEAENGISISADTTKADYYNDTWHIPVTLSFEGTAPSLNERGLRVYSTDSKELWIKVSVDNTTNNAHQVRSTRLGWVTVMGKNRRNGNHNVGTVLTHFEKLGSDDWKEVKNDEYGHYKPSNPGGGTVTPPVDDNPSGGGSNPPSGGDTPSGGGGTVTPPTTTYEYYIGWAPEGEYTQLKNSAFKKSSIIGDLTPDFVDGDADADYYLYIITTDPGTFTIVQSGLSALPMVSLSDWNGYKVYESKDAITKGNSINLSIARV